MSTEMQIMELIATAGESKGKAFEALKKVKENDFEVIYEAQSQHKNAAIYLLFVGSRYSEKWRHVMPTYKEIKECGNWIGHPLHPLNFQFIKNILSFLKNFRFAF